MTTMDQTKAKLLEAAGEEFAEKGFEGATVRSILNRAGVKNIAAINYYFGDKEQLYTQAVVEAHRCGVDMPSEQEAEAGTPPERLRSNIRHFLSNVLAVDRDHGWHHPLMMRELTKPTSASATLVREVIGPKFSRLVAILGEICPDADDRRLHVIAFSIVGQCLHYRMARPISERLIGPEEYASLDVDFLSDHIASFTLAALGQAPQFGADGRPAAEESVGGPSR